MKLVLVVLCLALVGGGCCAHGPAFDALQAAHDDYRKDADAAIDRDTVLTSGRKKALKAESEEISKTLKAARGK